MMIANQDLNKKDVKISTLKNDLRSENEFIERMNKPNEAIKYFDDLTRSQRTNGDTIGLGHSTTKKGESSKSGE